MTYSSECPWDIQGPLSSLPLWLLLSCVRFLVGLQPARLLCPWDFPGRNTRVGCHFLLQGIFPTQLDACVLISVLDLRFGSHSINNSSWELYQSHWWTWNWAELKKVVIIISVRVVKTQKPNFKFSFTQSVHGQLSRTLFSFSFLKSLFTEF